MAKDEPEVEDDKNLTACDLCGEEFNEDDMNDVQGSILCESCYDDETETCPECSERFITDDGYEGDASSDRYCSSDCYHENYYSCDNCGDDVHRDSINDGLCENCYEHESEYWDFSPRFQFYRTDETTKLNTHGFTIGVEMETINDDDVNSSDINFANTAQQEIFEARVGAKDDGSLSDGGVEFYTMPSSNDETYTTVKTICDVLKKNNFTVDRSCGLHIHIGEKKGEVKRLTPKNRHKIMILYGIFKDVMFRMVEARRTGNSYCDSPNYYLRPELFNIDGVTNPERLFEEVVRGRYSHLNLESWETHNTLEIRFHHGSVDFDEIKNWIALHTKLFDFACVSSYRDLLNLKANLYGVWAILNDKKLTDYYRAKIKKYRVHRGHFRKSKTAQNTIVPIMKRDKSKYTKHNVITELVPLIDA